MPVASPYIFYVNTSAYDLRKVSSVTVNNDDASLVNVRFIDEDKTVVAINAVAFLAAWQTSLNATGNGEVTPVVVADITNPVELALLTTNLAGRLVVATQIVAGNDITTLYAWDNTGATPNSPYVIGAVGGAWIAVGGRFINSQVSFNASVKCKQVALVDAALITTDCSKGNAFTVTLTDDRKLSNPTNKAIGAVYIWEVSQDGVGGHTLIYDTDFTWPGSTPPVITVGIGAVDIITGYYDGTKLRCTFVQAFA